MHRVPWVGRTNQIAWDRSLGVCPDQLSGSVHSWLLVDLWGNLASHDLGDDDDDDGLGYMPRGTNGALRHGILYNAK